MDPNIINCADGGCPEGTADSITDLSPEDQDAVKDALEIDPESVNKESPLVTSEKTLDEFTGKTVKEIEEEEEEDDEDSDSEEHESSAINDDEDTVEVSKDQIEDLVEDKEAFDKEFERFMTLRSGR